MCKENNDNLNIGGSEVEKITPETPAPRTVAYTTPPASGVFVAPQGRVAPTVPNVPNVPTVPNAANGGAFMPPPPANVNFAPPQTVGRTPAQNGVNLPPPPPQYGTPPQNGGINMPPPQQGVVYAPVHPNYNYNNPYGGHNPYGGYVVAPPPPMPPKIVKEKYKIPQQDMSDLGTETLHKRKILRRFHPERNDIRTSAKFCGLLMMLVELIPTLFVLLPQFLADTPVSVIFTPIYIITELMYKYLGDFAAAEISQMVYSSFVFTVPFILLTWCFKMKLRDVLAFSAPKKGVRLAFLFIGVSFCAFSQFASSGVLQFFEMFGITPITGSGESPDSVFIFILAFISTSLIPGMVEEFAFRGVLYGALKKYGEGFAILSTSILFGVLHGNLVQIPFAFAVGLVLGFIRAKTGSVWICIIVHAINNAVSVLYQYPLSHLPEDIQNISYTIYLCLSLLLGIVGVIMLSRREDAKDMYSLGGKETKCDERVVNSVFYSHPLILTFFIFIGLNVLLGVNISWIGNL